MADLVRRHFAVLRSGRGAHRRVWRHGRLRGAAGQQVSAATARTPVWRAPAVARHHQARDSGGRRPAREHDPADARVSTVPLLRQLRRRLRHGILLLLGRSLAAVRDEDREARDSVERGRREDSHRRHRPCHRCPVLRSADRRRTAGAAARSWFSARVAWTRPASCSTRNPRVTPTASAMDRM